MMFYLLTNMSTLEMLFIHMKLAYVQGTDKRS